MNTRIFVAAMVLAIAATSPQAQTVYKSIGPDGNIIYSDHPPANAKVERTFTFVELPSTPVPDLPPPPKNSPAQKSAHVVQAALPIGGVVMYSATWCGYCRRAKTYLAKNHIAYTNVDIDTLDGRAAFMQAGKGGVPLLQSGNRKIRGFTPEGYDAFFAGR